VVRAYTVYWERFGRFHRKVYTSKARAIMVAARASRMTGVYVCVYGRGAREVAECFEGKVTRQ
jgi:hypothetical protein